MGKVTMEYGKNYGEEWEKLQLRGKRLWRREKTDCSGEWWR